MADHAGWAHVVCTTVHRGVPTVIERRRVTLIDEGLPTLPYHHNTRAMKEDEANALIARVRRSIVACTTYALTHLVADLSPTHAAMALAIREPPFAELPDTVAVVQQSYRLQNAADGVMYHLAICQAARLLGLEVQLCRRGQEMSKAAHALGVTARQVEAFVGGAGRPAGPPWTEEHRRAFASGIAVLAARARERLRLPRP